MFFSFGDTNAVHFPPPDEERACATAIEYTLIASLIAVAAIAAFTTVGTKISSVMSNVAVNMG